MKIERANFGDEYILKITAKAEEVLEMEESTMVEYLSKYLPSSIDVLNCVSMILAGVKLEDETFELLVMVWNDETKNWQ